MVKLLDLNNDWKQVRPNLILSDDYVIYSGYQSFKMSKKEIIPLSDNTKLKYNLIKDTFEFGIRDKTVADLGCANMFFGFLSYLNGADNVVGIDLDKEYIKANNDIINYLSFNNIICKDTNVVDYQIKTDIVFAFAIIHWIYSCTACLESLESVINYLRSITNNCLYIEWIDPKDDCIEYFHHLDYNKELIKKDYDKGNFLYYLGQNFRIIEYIGKSKQTREIYRCFV